MLTHKCIEIHQTNLENPNSNSKWKFHHADHPSKYSNGHKITHSKRIKGDEGKPFGLVIWYR
jgi:hypothetical protein